MSRNKLKKLIFGAGKIEIINEKKDKRWQPFALLMHRI
jgi:hypothetical protein